MNIIFLQDLSKDFKNLLKDWKLDLDKVVCMPQELCSLILEESWRCETREVALHIMSGT